MGSVPVFAAACTELLGGAPGGGDGCVPFGGGLLLASQVPLVTYGILCVCSGLRSSGKGGGG